MDLTIQIVNFRSRHYLERCLFSIIENLPTGIAVEILIVNNDEESLRELGSRFENKISLRVVEIGKNIGFGPAHNVGFRESRGEYILFLNPDVEISSGTLGEMLAVFAGDEKIGIIGPFLIDPTGRIQPDCFGSHQKPLSAVGKKIFKKRKCPKSSNEEIFEADWVSGGAMLVRRNIFEKIKGFDENFFMYFEDVDLCLRAKKQGTKIVVNPKARIFHESGKSFASEREKKKYYYASQDYYFRKHFGPVSAWLVKLLRLPYYVKNIYFKC